jgi:hypothetical protein
LSSIDTTPDYPAQPEAVVESAARDLPAVLQEMPNETGYGASEPAHGQRIVLAQRLAEELVRSHGHAPGAAAWAIHRLVERGLLVAEVGTVVERHVIGHRPDERRMVVRSSGLFGHLADDPRYQEPILGEPERQPLAPTDRRVPYSCLLVRSTPALWEWQRAAVARPVNDRPSNAAELLAWCEDKVRVLAARVRAGGVFAVHDDMVIHNIGRQADALARAFCPPQLVLSLPVVPRTFPHVYDHQQSLTVLHQLSEWCRRHLAGGTADTAAANPSPVPEPGAGSPGAVGADGSKRRKPARTGRDRKQEARDRWIYQQCCRGREMPYDRIVAELKRIAAAKGWQIVSSKERIRQIGVAYADRHGKPRPPNRQNL